MSARILQRVVVGGTASRKRTEWCCRGRRGTRISLGIVPSGRGVEHLSNQLGIGEEGEREVAKVALEARQFFVGARPDANDGTPDGGKQIMLFLEG